MRGALFVPVLIFLGSCGYVGPVVPPSPEIPNAVSDLAVAERGNDLVITFTTPSRTTDNLAIRKFSEVELRVGSEPQPFDLGKWAAAAKQYDLPLPPENEKDVARPAPVTYSVPASDWVGQRISVAVRSAIKTEKDYSSWSNVAHLDVIAPLEIPKLSVEATAQGYKLTWAGEGAAVRYKIFRQGANDQAPVQIATTEKPEYTDTTSQWETPYTYSVVAENGSAESLPSNKEAVNHPDTFPPAVPVGVSAIAAGESIEINWERNPESDLKGYHIYRSINGSPFEQVQQLLIVPAYSDHQVEHGKTYRYEISATDDHNNESQRSAPVEVNF